jgi:hypothetical protein
MCTGRAYMQLKSDNIRLACAINKTTKIVTTSDTPVTLTSFMNIFTTFQVSILEKHVKYIQIKYNNDRKTKG